MKVRGHVPDGTGQMIEVEVEVDLTMFLEALDAVRRSLDGLSVAIGGYGDSLSRLRVALEDAGALPERRQRPRTGRLYYPDPRDVQAALEARGSWP